MLFKEIDTLMIHVPKTGGTTITFNIASKLYNISNSQDVLNLYNDREKRVVDRKVRKAHIPAYAYREKLGKDKYHSLYTFAFIRNPFEQIRSLFYQYRNMNIKINAKFKKYHEITFEDYVLCKTDVNIKSDKHSIDQVMYVKSRKGNSVIVNDVFPFDYYKESLGELSKKINVRMNTDIKYRETDVHDKYTPGMIDSVLDLYGHVYKFHKQVKKNFETNVLSKA